jgi:hypothetical protein
VPSEINTNTPADILGIPAYTLAELWAKIQPVGRIFLKIDIEGAECNFVNDPASEDCILSCHAVGAELHAGAKYGSCSLEVYEKWLFERFANTHKITSDRYHKHPNRLAQLRMIRKNGSL